MDCKKKARWKLYKDAEYCLERFLEAAPHKTPAVQLLTYHLTKHPIKTSKTCKTLLVELGRTHERSPPIDYSTWTHQC